jgi:AcrR family transcriptional regulator
MRAKRKADYHHGDLKRALIETAVKAIAKHGADAMSLRELAARAGVSPGAPYHHFANRGELMAAIAEEGFARLEARLIAARDAAPANASARLEALGLAYVTFAVSSLGHFRVMFHGDAKAAGPAEAGLRAFHILREAVEACQQAGEAPEGDATGLVLVAWSAVHGFATLWADRALPFLDLEPERLAPEIGRLIARMFSGLARQAVAGGEHPRRIIRSI